MSFLEGFDPKTQKPPVFPKWATYAPLSYNRSAWKTHSSEGIAKTAFTNSKSSRRPVVLCEYVNGEWVEVKRYDPSKPL
jgi:hypothetical protein